MYTPVVATDARVRACLVLHALLCAVCPALRAACRTRALDRSKRRARRFAGRVAVAEDKFVGPAAHPCLKPCLPRCSNAWPRSMPRWACCGRRSPLRLRFRRSLHPSKARSSRSSRRAWRRRRRGGSARGPPRRCSAGAQLRGCPPGWRGGRAALNCGATARLPRAAPTLLEEGPRALFLMRCD
jgi:hypothetical protein